ncbi:MAG: hypothetical protein Q9207_003505 [Kuettlingeria erythrocarpa]
MQDFLAVVGDKTATEAFSCRSWDGLEGEVATAMETLEGHEKKGGSWRNPFEAADKLGGVAARRIEFLIELTVKRKKEIRKTILDMLDSLGDTVSHSKAQIRLYLDDPDLKEKSEGLYTVTLDFVRYVVAYLHRSIASISLPPTP